MILRGEKGSTRRKSCHTIVPTKIPYRLPSTVRDKCFKCTGYVTGHAWQTVTLNALMPNFMNIVLFVRKPLRMIHTHVHV
jgi:hypothetical protein